MKKNVIFSALCAFLALCLCVLCACGSANDNSSAPVDLNNEYTPGGEIPYFGLYSEEEYEDYLCNLPLEFVFYDQISYIGDFISVVFLEDARDLHYNSYLYSLKSGNTDLMLYVSPHSDAVIINDILSQQTSIDLHYYPSKESGSYYDNDIEYKYKDGVLFSIGWSIGDLDFVLCTSSTSWLGLYTPTNETMANLFNKENNIEALHFIKEKIRNTEN